MIAFIGLSVSQLCPSRARQFKFTLHLIRVPPVSRVCVFNKNKAM